VHCKYEYEWENTRLLCIIFHGGSLARFVRPSVLLSPTHLRQHVVRYASPNNCIYGLEMSFGMITEMKLTSNLSWFENGTDSPLGLGTYIYFKYKKVIAGMTFF
jgi:hypothetical protein